MHGPFTGSTSRWARNNASRWTTNAGQSINWNGRPSFTYYTSNYANWWYGSEEGARATRWEVVRDVAKNLIDELDGVNLGLMRYRNNQGTFNDGYAEGGMIMHPVVELTAAVNKTTLKNLLTPGTGRLHAAVGTLYEATQYFRGAAVDYGVNSRLNGRMPPSVAGSCTGGTLASGTYNSPIDQPPEQLHRLPD
ncbi:MAG: hypothetical protein R3E65_09665 [Steroidobacteraceae bacterium]